MTSRNPIEEAFSVGAEFGLFKNEKGKEEEIIASSDDPDELEDYISVRSKMPIHDDTTFYVAELEEPEVLVSDPEEDEETQKEDPNEENDKESS